MIFATADNVAEREYAQVEQAAKPLASGTSPDELLLTLDPSSVVLRRLIHRVDYEPVAGFDGRQ
ncbi:hypothetical protein P9139_04255 [Curtobacterium flaccumfaciens]|nr:hypothetical protein P9139_04255 [Curtobacterium flaccumfaciens]